MPKSQLPEDTSESLYLDVTGHSTPDTAPLGSINRARWPAEMASRKARLGRLISSVSWDNGRDYNSPQS
jgi:hypothetical protein